MTALRQNRNILDSDQGVKKIVLISFFLSNLWLSLKIDIIVADVPILVIFPQIDKFDSHFCNPTDNTVRNVRGQTSKKRMSLDMNYCNEIYAALLSDKDWDLYFTTLPWTSSCRPAHQSSCEVWS